MADYFRCSRPQTLYNTIRASMPHSPLKTTCPWRSSCQDGGHIASTAVTLANLTIVIYEWFVLDDHWQFPETHHDRPPIPNREKRTENCSNERWNVHSIQIANRKLCCLSPTWHFLILLEFVTIAQALYRRLWGFLPVWKMKRANT